jgi:hypothetical protein
MSLWSGVEVAESGVALAKTFLTQRVSSLASVPPLQYQSFSYYGTTHSIF